MLEEWTQEVSDILHLFMVLDTTKRKPFTVKSAFARTNAAWVAFCASEAFLTTRIGAETWGNKWLITAAGEQLLKELEDDLSEYTKH